MNYDRFILELMDRVTTLENEVTSLKSIILKNEQGRSRENTDSTSVASNEINGRDTTKYIFEGKRYGKNRLVLAIIQKYMIQHPNTSAEELMILFDKSLQGSLGVVRRLDEVKEIYSDYKRRFFTGDNEVINTSNGICVVCTQWGIGNIANILKRAEQLNIKIDVIN